MNHEKRAELLMDHYKDTFQHILYHWRARNRLFMCILIVLSVMALDAYQPETLSKLINCYIAHAVGGKEGGAPEIGFAVVGSMAWFLLLCLVVQYYQRSIHVDRQYNYVATLEGQICELMGGDYVAREGRAYLSRTGALQPGDGPDRRPLYLRLIGPLYTYVFTFVLTGLILLRVFWIDWPPKEKTGWFNLVVGIVIVVFNLLYLGWVIRSRLEQSRRRQ